MILKKEPETTFKEVGREFIVTFKRKTAVLKTREKTKESIIILMEKNPKITTQKLAEKIGLSIKGIEWNIKLLKKEKRLQRIGE